jgi:hypothetical protein
MSFSRRIACLGRSIKRPRSSFDALCGPQRRDGGPIDKPAAVSLPAVFTRTTVVAAAQPEPHGFARAVHVGDDTPFLGEERHQR